MTDCGQVECRKGSSTAEQSAARNGGSMIRSGRSRVDDCSTLISGRSLESHQCRRPVESTTGAVTIGVASLFPRLSVRGAPLATPWLRFQSPLIEPDMRITRIRLSDKTSCFRPRKVACADDDGATAKCAYLAPVIMALLATTQAARCRPAGSSINNVRVLPSLPHGMHFATSETARVV
jgi:hypothetical protein